MMLLTNTKMAISTVRSAKLRSLLTMLGIIIGVMSVVLSVALAQGLKHDTAAQLNELGDTFLTIRPGNFGTRDGQGGLQNVDLSAGLTGSVALSTLNEEDVKAISGFPELSTIAPVMMINGSVTNGDKTQPNSLVIATSPDLPNTLQRKLESGDFFSSKEVDRPFVVIGHSVAQTLFGVDAPLGSKLQIRGKEFVIVGIMEKEKTGAINFGPNLDNAVYIPISSGKVLSGGDARFQSIYLSVQSAKQVDETVKKLNDTIKAQHNGEQDFTVLKQEDALSFTDNIGKVITTATALIMSISLVVAGVGIMNIMLVSVTERTREIGIRKALGATNRQILYQFFVEALVLSTLGGLTGLMLSVLASLAINAYTDLTMVISPVLIAVALGVSIGIGGIFGVIPALKAARKDPIVALRNE